MRSYCTWSYEDFAVSLGRRRIYRRPGVVASTYLSYETRWRSRCDWQGKSQARYKRYFDKKTKERRFSVGDTVLPLLPTDTKKLLMHWRGPIQIEIVVEINDYAVKVKGKRRIFQANLVKIAKALFEENKTKDAKTDFWLALLQYRNTPTEGFQSSPAQRLFIRQTKTNLPAKTTTPLSMLLVPWLWILLVIGSAMVSFTHVRTMPRKFDISS